MRLFGRPLGTVLGAPFEARHWRALVNMARVYPRFVEGFSRYALGRGRYPVVFPVRTPLGKAEVKLWSRDDMLTLNEVFCRGDYPAGAVLRTAVDFGANIGISALFFLTRDPAARAYLFEPLPLNVERLRENLRAHAGRFVLREVAVGTASGQVRFGWEDTGRYGGIGHAELPRQIDVAAVDANEARAEVLAERGEIDVLKIDVEGMEAPILEHLRPEIRSRIRAVYAECPAGTAALPEFSRRQYGNVVQLRRR